MELSIGYDPKGQYRMSVSSIYVHLLPPSEGAVLSGRYVSDLQKDLEIWMRSLVPSAAIVSAKRSYANYDGTEDFLKQ